MSAGFRAAAPEGKASKRSERELQEKYKDKEEGTRKK